MAPRPAWNAAAAALLLLAALAGAQPRAMPRLRSYPAVGPGWAAPLQSSLRALAATPSPVLRRLAAADLSQAAGRESAAPLLRQLAALAPSPEAFAALPDSERAAALELAAEAASEELARDAAELLAAARLERGVAGAAGRERLYHLVANLDRLAHRYPGYLDEATTRRVRSAYAQAADRAWKERAELLGDRPPSWDGAASPPPASAAKLYERMRASPNGWRLEDVRALLRSHGFEERQGNKHIVFRHPLRPELGTTLSRSSGDVGPAYVRESLKLVERSRPARRPERIALSDLRVLLSP